MLVKENIRSALCLAYYYRLWFYGGTAAILSCRSWQKYMQITNMHADAKVCLYALDVASEEVFLIGA